MNNSATQSPFSVIDTRAPFEAGRVFTTPASKLLQISCGLSEEQLRLLFVDAPGRVREKSAAVAATERREARRAYAWWDAAAVVSAFVAFSAYVVALVLG